MHIGKCQLGTCHYLSPGGGKRVGGVMKKLEINKGGVTAFLVDQAGVVMIFF